MSDRGQTPEVEGDTGQADWMDRMAGIGAAHGLFDRVGSRHLSLFVEEGDTLLVAFDRAERVRETSPDGFPAGFEMVRRRSWSLLSIMSEGETWFRGAALARFFRALGASGVFSGFGRVLFYGVGPDCGFAACVFSRFAPGARVLAANPVATLDPASVPFERRFRDARRLDFSGPLGNAARALALSEAALILFDPTEIAEAAQAALFTGPRVTRLGLPHAGRDLGLILRDREVSVPILRALENGPPNTAVIRALMQEPCREAPGTMIRRARAALVQGHPCRAAVIARYGLDATGDRRLAALLNEAEAEKPPRRRPVEPA